MMLWNARSPAHNSSSKQARMWRSAREAVVLHCCTRVCEYVCCSMMYSESALDRTVSSGLTKTGSPEGPNKLRNSMAFGPYRYGTSMYRYHPAAAERCRSFIFVPTIRRLVIDIYLSSLHFSVLHTKQQHDSVYLVLFRYTRLSAIICLNDILLCAGCVHQKANYEILHCFAAPTSSSNLH